MRLSVKDRSRGGIEFGIIYGGIALAALCAARFLSPGFFSPTCAFKRLMGMPCPTCGATRAVVHMAQGDLFVSFVMNPMVATALSIAVFSLIYRVATFAFTLPRLEVTLTDKDKDRSRACAIALVILNWAYLIATGR